MLTSFIIELLSIFFCFFLLILYFFLIFLDARQITINQTFNALNLESLPEFLFSVYAEELEAVTRDCQTNAKTKTITLIFNVDQAASLFQHQILQLLVKQYKWME